MAPNTNIKIAESFSSLEMSLQKVRLQLSLDESHDWIYFRWKIEFRKRVPVSPTMTTAPFSTSINKTIKKTAVSSGNSYLPTLQKYLVHVSMKSVRNATKFKTSLPFLPLLRLWLACNPNAIHICSSRDRSCSVTSIARLSPQSSVRIAL